jgi:hypothetical protein
MSGRKKASNLLRDPRLVLSLVALVIVIAVGKRVVGLVQDTGAEGKSLDVKGAIKSVDVDRNFSFAIVDGSGEELSKLQYNIQKAELRDEIIVKGQKATAVDGRVFLILTIKLTNTFDKAIEIDTRDYVRLSVNNNQKEWLAPDIHNDPVQIQAISTKFSRIGFPINSSDKDYLLQVGEINGSKTKAPLKL